MEGNGQKWIRLSNRRLSRTDSPRSSNVQGLSYRETRLRHSMPVRHEPERLPPNNDSRLPQANQPQANRNPTDKPPMEFFLAELVQKSGKMKSTPDTVSFVCESFKVPHVTLKDASQRTLNPAPEVPRSGWEIIHDEINKLRRE